MIVARAMRLLPLIAAAIAIPLCSAGCGGSSATAVLDPVAQAAQVTSHAGGAHLALSVQVSGSGLPSPFTMSGQGYFNYKSQEGALTFEAGGLPAGFAPNLPAGSLHIEELFKSSTVYVGSPLFSSKLPGGARWMKLDIGRFAQAVGFNLQQLAGGQTNPARFLQYLAATGSAPVPVGQETVRGVATTHYRASIDLNKVANVLHSGGAAQLRSALSKLTSQIGTSKIPVDVWVDAHKLVRRIALALSLSPSGSSQAHVGMTMELFDFGPTPAVSTPAAGEVFDATQSALSALGSH
jgi:hypothetical protein